MEMNLAMKIIVYITLFTYYGEAQAEHCTQAAKPG